MSATIRIGMSTSDLAAGAESTFKALEEAIRDRQPPVTLKSTGSLGASHREPVVEVELNGQSTLYGPVTAERVRPLLKRHFGPEHPGPAPDWLMSQRPDRSDYPFLGRQVKVTTQLCGVIDPSSLDDYLEHDGYQAFKKVLTMQPEAVGPSRTRNCGAGGGAGYPTGIKWELLRRSRPGLERLIPIRSAVLSRSFDAWWPKVYNSPHN